MTTERGVVRRIAWFEVFPWLILLRTFRIAISPTVLALATLAVLLVPVGDRLGAVLFLPKEKIGDRWVIQHPDAKTLPITAWLPDAVKEYLPASASGLAEPFARLADPLYRIFRLEMSVRDVAYYAFGWLWSLAVWGFVGGTITRIALVRLATGEPPSLRPTISLVGRRYLWYVLAPLYPLLGVAIVAVPIALLGLPLWLHAGIGSLLAGLVWIVVLLASLAAAWLLAGLLFGWPLMWPVISAERDADPFEAFSRSFSYVYGKPLHYLFYVLVAAALGALGLAVVVGAAAIVVEFSWWALSWGAGREAVEQLRGLVDAIRAGGDLPDDVARLRLFGAMGVAAAISLANAIVTGYTFAYFWSVASAIYLLLRYDVDEKEMDEIYFEVVKPVSPPGDGASASPSSSAPAVPPAPPPAEVPPPLPPESPPPQAIE